MRVTGGRARGIPLQSGGRADALRPATDMMRQAVFSSLGARVEGARCVDLFAGTGAYGLEALSRGAASLLFVEQDRSALVAIAKNIQAVCKSMGVDTSSCRAEQRDALGAAPFGGPFDIVFADPPYSLLPQKAGALFDAVAALLAPGGLLVFEMPGGLELSDARMSLTRRLGKGRNAPSVCIFSFSGPTA